MSEGSGTAPLRYGILQQSRNLKTSKERHGHIIMKKYKKFLAAAVLLLMVITLFSTAVFAASYPTAENYVADEAGLLTENTIKSIKENNKILYGDTKLIIAVCTVNNTGGEDIGTYARNLFTEWKLGDGILLLISKEDNNYYFVPSVGVEDILSNEQIASIRDEFFEADFNNGDIDRAVVKAVTKLNSTLLAGFSEREAASTKSSDPESTPTEKGTTAGNVIVTIFKTILWIVIIAVILFIALFVWAMFNDDVAALMQKYIFRRGSGRSSTPPDYYDERLYGRQQRPRSSSQQQRVAPKQQNGYNGYLGDGRQRPQQNRQYPNQNYNNQNYSNYNNPPYGQQQYQNPYPSNQYQYQQNPAPQNQYQQQYPNGQYQQNPNNGYYNRQQNPYPQNNRYPVQNQNPNYYNRQGYNQGYTNTSNDNDATRQFNIPRRN